MGIVKKQKINKILGALETIGIVISEIYKFFTWHIMSITGEMSIHNSIEFAFPEFYIGLVSSLIMIFVYLWIVSLCFRVITYFIQQPYKRKLENKNKIMRNRHLALICSIISITIYIVKLKIWNILKT